MKQPTLIVVCGWPLSGKTTIAKIVAKRLGIHRIDIDELRHLCIGLPHPHPNTSPELMKKNNLEMGVAYELLLHVADIHLRLGRSVIIIATFSKMVGQEDLLAVLKNHPEASMRIVWCFPFDDNEEEIKRRLARGFGEGYVGGVNSLERYRETKKGFESIALPHIKIDTSSLVTQHECVTRAIGYIIS